MSEKANRDFIQLSLERLGIFAGLYEIEDRMLLEENGGYLHLEVGKNLLLRPAYQTLETFAVVTKHLADDPARPDCYIIEISVLTLYELVGGISPIALENLYGIVTTLLQREFNHDELNSNEKNFIAFLNEQLLYRCYAIWKENYRRLLAQLHSNLERSSLLPPYLLDQWQELQQLCSAEFVCSRDLIMGLWVQGAFKGIQQAVWKWGILLLLQRIVHKFADRRFELDFHYRHGAILIHEQSSMRLGQSRLGKSCLGQEILYNLHTIEISVKTPSLELYLYFYPNGIGRKFLERVVRLWSCAGITADYPAVTWKFCYTGFSVCDRLATKEALYSGEARLGYSTWLAK